MASKPCCAAGAPFVIEYTPLGSTSKVGDLDVYTTGSGDKVIVFIYDIFGWPYKQCFQVADRIAAGGFKVIMPDHFRGKPWTMERFPPKPEDDFMGWLGKAGDWETVVKPDVLAVVESEKKAGGNPTFGCVGFCWGGLMAFKTVGSEVKLSSAAALHAAFFGADKALAEDAQAPVCLLPAKGDPGEESKAVLDTKPFASKCVLKRFDDQEHGFCAARGDFNDPKVAAGAAEAIDIVSTFFKDTL